VEADLFAVSIGGVDARSGGQAEFDPVMQASRSVAGKLGLEILSFAALNL
jgi:hypothetical protein